MYTSIETSWRVALLFIGTTVALPLTYFRRIARLDLLATLGVAMVACIAAIVVRQYCKWDGTAPNGGPVRMGGSPMDIGAVVPIIVFAFNCHVQTPRIYRELRQATNQTRWSNVALCAYAFCTLMYIVVGVMGYMMFGNKVKADVVAEPTLKSPFWRFLVGSQAVVAYLVNHFPLREALYDLLCMASWMPMLHVPKAASQDDHIIFRESDGAIPLMPSILLAVIIYLTAAMMALYVENLTVFAPLLGTLGAMLSFVCPAACLWHLHDGLCHRLSAVFFALCGIFVFCVYLLLPLGR